MTITRIALASSLSGVVLMTAAACGSPSAQGLLNDPAEPPPLACDGCPDDQELARAAKTTEQLAFVRRVNAIELALTGKPLSRGNSVELLRDGPATHEAQLEAIRKARHHVHLITYILTDDQVAQDYLKALVDRRKHGVQVRLMFDAVGGRTVGQPFRDTLAAAKVEVREFGPIHPVQSNPVKGVQDWQLSRRHHRKLLIVDGRVAFTGGINVSDEYRASSAGGSKAAGWRDTHVRIEGPAVRQFQDMFFESWELVGDPAPKDDAFRPKLRRKGNEFVRGVNQRGNDLHEVALRPVADLGRTEKEEDAQSAIYGSYLAAMGSARQRIWITQAYFIPNKEFIEVLVRAARRGVDVRLLVPATSDIALMVQASRYHYAPLLEAGAHIYEYRGPMLHAKTAVIDSVWATVGSSNLDFRSFIHNDEANAIIVGHEFGAKMEQMFADDLKNADEITRDEWSKRSWTARFNQRLAALLKYWI